MKCAWCGTGFPDKKRGGHVKRFCRDECRFSWHKASSKLMLQLEHAGALNVRKWHDFITDRSKIPEN